ncbi:MAG: gamma-butyrobetaine hydroxylase-like domain-containing protein [Candidatus Thiodiazotropha lotti]|nr:gamma-butyrobetaine hydroxylase-like domain-containing protein [Candidatus Thiodiazotropha lotti]MCW4221215.1 gamma-butyrobetaine hydroxylase-like domain-containing protein [Candidatus Thiodiazotropha lotti]
MTTECPIPVEINLHRKTRLLALHFSDGSNFELPCEYLRVFSTAAEVKASDIPITGKECVNIEKIEPQGQYAVRLVFDDGHDTGIYSWQTLYQLGSEYQKNWQKYLTKLDTLGYQRQQSEQQDRSVKLFYFAWLADKTGKESEEIELPQSVTTIAELLKLLRMRRPEIAPVFDQALLRPIVNKQFAELFTHLDHGDEVALVPNQPTPPATPDI